jgi:hypothetical protein
VGEPDPWVEADWLRAAGLGLEIALAAVARPASGFVEIV